MGTLYRGLYTRFKCQGDININYPYDKTVCFNSLVQALKRFNAQQLVHNKYYVQVFKARESEDIHDGNPNANATLLTKDELINHLRSAQRLFKFSFKIITYEHRYTICIDINQPPIYHRYLMSWIRYTYEYPFNIACLDAHIMRQQPECRFISLPNLMNLALSFTREPRIDHCIATFGINKGLTNKQLKERFNQTDRLNNFYSRVPDVPYRLFENRYSTHREDQLVDFGRRKEVYLNMYKIYTKPE